MSITLQVPVERGGAAAIGSNPAGKTVYWHRELPPLDAEVMSEHTLEATSSRVPGTLTHRDELWDRCYEDLIARTRAGWNRRAVINSVGHVRRYRAVNGPAGSAT